jgi:hypothetical protein
MIIRCTVTYGLRRSRRRETARRMRQPHKGYGSRPSMKGGLGYCHSLFMLPATDLSHKGCVHVTRFYNDQIVSQREAGGTTLASPFTTLDPSPMLAARGIRRRIAYFGQLIQLSKRNWNFWRRDIIDLEIAASNRLFGEFIQNEGTISDLRFRFTHLHGWFFWQGGAGDESRANGQVRSKLAKRLSPRIFISARKETLALPKCQVKKIWL